MSGHVGERAVYTRDGAAAAAWQGIVPRAGTPCLWARSQIQHAGRTEGHGSRNGCAGGGYTNVASGSVGHAASVEIQDEPDADSAHA